MPRGNMVYPSAATAVAIPAHVPPNGTVSSGLLFPSNSQAGSDIRMVWDGANLLSRTAQTVLWKVKYNDQQGYYAVAWSAHQGDNGGSFFADNYEFGTHPYPASNGNVDANGQSLSGSGGTGTIQFHELAGLGARDYLSSPGGTAVQVVKNVWYSQARSVEVIGGTTLRHTYWFDLANNPSQKTVQDITLASLPAAGATPAFYFGASAWTASGTGPTETNVETISGVLRGMQLYAAALTEAQILALSAKEDDAAVLAYQSANGLTPWYLNMNPIPGDVTDKSSASHTPRWPTGNNNRPTLWVP